jgi:hypothetical protein
VKKHSGLLLAASALAIVLVSIATTPASSGGHKGDIAKQAAEGSLRAATLTIKRNGKTISKPMPFLSDSTVASAEEALVGFQDERLEGADAAAAASDAGFPDIGQAEGTLGCSRRDNGHDADHGSGGERGRNQGGGNVRVNQDCSFRRQAETDITYNPVNPDNIVGGQNDSRVGYNQCGIDWSLDNGKHWGDLLPPFRQRTNHPELMGPSTTNPNDNSIAHDDGTGHTYDAGSDPASAVDSQGRAYFSCVVFDVASNASGLYVTQAPQGADGSFYFNIPDAPNKRFMVVEDNSPITFHDKNMISADRYSSSPNHDNVYVTWTVFKFNASCLGGTPDAPTFCESPIFGSMSTDHGVTWSTPQEISGAAKGLCQFGDFFTQNPANANDCNFDQGSYSVVMPNGDLELVFNNTNTPTVDAQQLGVHCKPAGSSTAGTAHLNCASPVKVGDDVETGEPTCDFGRGPEQCIPGPFIRTNDFPRITKDNTQNNHLSAVWQDYRNGELDIQMSQSLDGGLTWHEVGTVNPDTGLDHYFAATDQSPTRSDRIGVSYYRSERVANESAAGSAFTGGGVFAPCDPGNAIPAGADSCVGVDEGDSDYALAGGTGDKTPYDFRVLSPVFAPPDGAQAGFNGDYSGLTINRDEQAHPLWSDTRNADPFTPANGVLHDEDAFTDSVSLPNGKGKAGPGHMGH